MTKRLTDEEKQAIRADLAAYVETYGSQSKAATSLKKTSAGTVSCVLNGRFENISDEMLLNIAAQIGHTGGEGWQICRTSAYRDIETFLQDAQMYHNVSWIVAPAGIGKTTAAQRYASRCGGVFVLGCSEDMHKSDFVDELARKIGVRSDGLTVRGTLNRIVESLVKTRNPLLVFDEADKLTDSVLYYFISLYNRLEGKCGIVFLSTQYIERRMSRGLRLDKKGYEELYSRIGRRFVTLTGISAAEVDAICRSNGLEDEAAIRRVLEESSESRKGRPEFDLRRVKKSVHKEMRIASAARLGGQGQGRV